jgi:putative hydrolase of the HAD superfamily
MRTAILFDLGNTLVRYFDRPEFPSVLEQAITNVQAYLHGEGMLHVTAEYMWQQVAREDHEAVDNRVRPLEGRLSRIFQLDPGQAQAVMPAMCRRFLKPIFQRAQRYEDTLPLLTTLRHRGFKTAIVSNLPWGSPGAIWRQEVIRHELDEWLDAVVFCTDVGWRKPAKQIFEAALDWLQARPRDCVFVGDNPRWDIAGARAVGMEAVLIDRHGSVAGSSEEPIRGLAELEGWIERGSAL